MKTKYAIRQLVEKAIHKRLTLDKNAINSELTHLYISDVDMRRWNY